MTTPIQAGRDLRLWDYRFGIIEREWLLAELRKMKESTDSSYGEIIDAFIDRVNDGMRDAGTETIDSNSVFAARRDYLEVRMCYRHEAADLLLDLHVALSRADQVEREVMLDSTEPMREPDHANV